MVKEKPSDLYETLMPDHAVEGYAALFDVTLTLIRPDSAYSQLSRPRCSALNR